MEYLESQVWKLTTELAAVKNTVTSNAARREEVTPQITSDNIEMQNLTNKKAGETEVHSSSDEHNVSVKLDNILTISEDNGNEAPGGSGDDKKNLKPKTKGKRSWWQWTTAPNHPPPTSGAESGADTEKVLEGTPDDHLQLQHNDKNPDPGAVRAQGVTHIELEARLTKLQDFIKVNNFDKLQERIKENEVRTEKDLKTVEKETDKLLQDLENRLGLKITNCKTKRQAIIESHNKIVTRTAHLEQNLSRIEDQFDTLKKEKDTALVVADNKLVEQTDNTDTLKHLLGHFASDPSPGGTQSVIGLLHSYQFIRKASKSLLNNRFPQYSHEKDCQFCSIVNLRM